MPRNSVTLTFNCVPYRSPGAGIAGFLAVTTRLLLWIALNSVQPVPLILSMTQLREIDTSADIALAIEIRCELFAAFLNAPDAQDSGVASIHYPTSILRCCPENEDSWLLIDVGAGSPRQVSDRCS